MESNRVRRWLPSFLVVWLFLFLPHRQHINAWVIFGSLVLAIVEYWLILSLLPDDSGPKP